MLEQTALIAHNAAFDMRMLSNDLQRCGLHHSGSRLRQHLFCSAEAFGALRPSSPRDLTTACYLLGIADGGPGSAWRAVHSALADAVLTAKVVMAINTILQEAPPSEFTALPPLPCRLQRVSEGQAIKARKLGKFSWCCDLFLLKQMGENSRTAHKY